MPTEVLKSRLSIKHTVHLNNSHRSFRFPACHPKHEELNTTGRQRTWTAQWWNPAPRCSYHSKPHLLEWVSCRSLAFSNTIALKAVCKMPFMTSYDLEVHQIYISFQTRWEGDNEEWILKEEHACRLVVSTNAREVMSLVIYTLVWNLKLSINYRKSNTFFSYIWT